MPPPPDQIGLKTGQLRGQSPIRKDVTPIIIMLVPLFVSMASTLN